MLCRDSSELARRVAGCERAAFRMGCYVLWKWGGGGGCCRLYCVVSALCFGTFCIFHPLLNYLNCFAGGEEMLVTWAAMFHVDSIRFTCRNTVSSFCLYNGVYMSCTKSAFKTFANIYLSRCQRTQLKNYPYRWAQRV